MSEDIRGITTLGTIPISDKKLAKQVRPQQKAPLCCPPVSCCESKKEGEAQAPVEKAEQNCEMQHPDHKELPLLPPHKLMSHPSPMKAGGCCCPPADNKGGVRNSYQRNTLPVPKSPLVRNPYPKPSSKSTICGNCCK